MGRDSGGHPRQSELVDEDGAGRDRPRSRGLGAPRAPAASPEDPAPYGWAPIAVIVLVVLVDRIETHLVFGVLSQIQAEWGISDTWAGAIPTASAIAGCLVALPAGYLADRRSRKSVIAVVVAVWSVVTLGSALAVSFAMFFATRVLLGAADSMDGPAASSLLADYYPPATRARVYGWFRLAFFAGGSLGLLFGGVVGGLLGWRAPFLVILLPGLLVAGLCWRLREPARGFTDRLTAADPPGPLPVPPPGRPAEPGAGGGAGERRAKLGRFLAELRGVLATRTLLRMYIGLMMLFSGLSGVFVWLPSYYERVFGLGSAGAGAAAALVTFVGIVGGAWFGGWLGDRWHGVVPGGRVLTGGGGLLAGSLVLAGANVLTVLPAQLAALAAALFLLALAIPTLTAAVADVVRAEVRGAAFALLQLVAVVGFAVGPLAVGAVSDATGLRTAFLVLTAPVVAGSVLVLSGRRFYEEEAAAVLAAARSEN